MVHFKEQCITCILFYSPQIVFISLNYRNLLENNKTDNYLEYVACSINRVYLFSRSRFMIKHGKTNSSQCFWLWLQQGINTNTHLLFLPQVGQSSCTPTIRPYPGEHSCGVLSSHRVHQLTDLLVRGKYYNTCNVSIIIFKVNIVICYF